MNDTIVIGITLSNTRHEYYPLWIKNNDSNIEIVLFSANRKDENSLASCDALVLTGGTDLHPATYNHSNLQYPNAPSNGWEEERDHFEQRLFREAISKKMPILAICRGLQLVNVTLGGTLIADLEASGKNNHRRNENADGKHFIQVVPDTLLYRIAGSNELIVNSAHHQSVDILAEPLTISALSPDHVIEAVEWKAPLNHAPLLAVQWHPERMESSFEGSLSNGIREWLLEQAAIFHTNKS